MYIVCVTIFVKPTLIDPFIDATLDNARNTRREPNNIRFDVIQAEDDPSRFMLYEVYRSKEDFAAHQTTAHYLKWKSAAADLVAQPRTSTRNRAIFFGDGTEA
jgi:autoinducer 2-degrading protein